MAYFESGKLVRDARERHRSNEELIRKMDRMSSQFFGVMRELAPAMGAGVEAYGILSPDSSPLLMSGEGLFCIGSVHGESLNSRQVLLRWEFGTIRESMDSVLRQAADSWAEANPE